LQPFGYHRCMRAGSAVISGAVALLVLSCSGPDAPGDRSAPSHGALTASVSPSQRHTALSSPASRSPGFLLTVPTAHPEAFARGLDHAVATLGDQLSAPGELRRAGEYQQLAVHRLASASSAFRRAVLARTGRETAAEIAREVRAANSLAQLTAPRKHLPQWRIITPPPMGQLRDYYAEAQRLTGAHWTYLAAINLVETRMGRIRGASPAGALGPMQFLPSTWATYGAGGDIDNPRDAILAAARLLRANGAPGDMAGALYHYNPSEQYVRAITEYARTLRRAPYIYRGYYHWRVLYHDVHGLYVLPEGYPRVHPVLLEPR